MQQVGGRTRGTRHPAVWGLSISKLATVNAPRPRRRVSPPDSSSGSSDLQQDMLPGRHTDQGDEHDLGHRAPPDGRSGPGSSPRTRRARRRIHACRDPAVPGALSRGQQGRADDLDAVAAPGQTTPAAAPGSPRSVDSGHGRVAARSAHRRGVEYRFVARRRTSSTTGRPRCSPPPTARASRWACPRCRPSNTPRVATERPQLHGTSTRPRQYGGARTAVMAGSREPEAGSQGGGVRAERQDLELM